MPQAGTVYRYLRVDADHDVSSDTLELSFDGGATWVSAGVAFIAEGSWPASVSAANTAAPAAAGLTGYWWRFLSGPDDIALEIGPNRVLGRVTDSPEIPHFGWTVQVGRNE